MNVPQTRYAKSGELNIAYQVVGEGPFDLVYVPGLHFESLGARRLKGVPEDWQIFAASA